MQLNTLFLTAVIIHNLLIHWIKTVQSQSKPCRHLQMLWRKNPFCPASRHCWPPRHSHGGSKMWPSAVYKNIQFCLSSHFWCLHVCQRAHRGKCNVSGGWGVSFPQGMPIVLFFESSCNLAVAKWRFGSSCIKGLYSIAVLQSKI